MHDIQQINQIYSINSCAQHNHIATRQETKTYRNKDIYIIGYKLLTQAMEEN